MSSRKAIEEKLFEFVTKELLDGDAQDLTPATNLLALGVIDSLSMEQLETFVEKTFGVKIPSSVQPDDMSSIAAMAGIVERLEHAASVKGR